MFQSLEYFSVASDLATYSTHRHSVLAQNIANADTPGFKSRDFKPFDEIYNGKVVFERLHDDHVLDLVSFEVNHPGNSSPNGNTVSLETEMIKSVKSRQAHNLAITSYKSGLNLLKTTLGR